MRKIASEFDHPLDNLFINISEKISPALHSVGMTPNMITFISLIFGVLSIYFLWSNHIILFSLCYLLCYFFDCADGFFARKYKMTTKFGDYFDHVKDYLVCLGIIIVFIVKFGPCLSWYHWVLIGVIFLLAILGVSRQMGCQEMHYMKQPGVTQDEKNSSLSAHSGLCKGGDPMDEMRMRRWLGCGNFVLILILVVMVTFYTCRGTQGK